MKRLQWILSTMLIIAMLLSCMPGASALTVEEWNAQCTVKTVKNTIVYRPDAAGNKTQVATIPAGTFVQQNAFDNASQMWNITFLTSNGATAWGLVSASSLEVTSVTIKLDDGTEVEVPEELSSNLEAAAAYLNQTKTDHYYTVNTADGIIHAGDISEKPQTDTTKMEVPEGYEAAVVEDTFGGGESTSASESTDSQESTTAVADVTTTQTDTTVTQADATTTQTDTQTTQTDTATNSFTDNGEKIDYHRVIMLGSFRSLVNINGAQQTVDTGLIDFGTEVPYEEQLATINAPKTGKCTLLAEAKKGAAKLGTLKHGTIVGVIRTGKTYTRIFANGMEGVVTNASIKTLTRGSTPIGNGVLTYNGQIDNSKQINIRAKASTSAKVFDHWISGTEVTIWDKNGSFYEIEANGIRAFVNEKFLTQGDKSSIPVKSTQTPKKKTSGGSKKNTSTTPSQPAVTVTAAPPAQTTTNASTTTNNTTTPGASTTTNTGTSTSSGNSDINVAAPNNGATATAAPGTPPTTSTITTNVTSDPGSTTQTIIAPGSAEVEGPALSEAPDGSPSGTTTKRLNGGSSSSSSSSNASANTNSSSDSKGADKPGGLERTLDPNEGVPKNDTPEQTSSGQMVNAMPAENPASSGQSSQTNNTAPGQSTAPTPYD